MFSPPIARSSAKLQRLADSPLPNWNETDLRPARFIREGKTAFSLPETPPLSLKEV
jgi:hypothetical protein